MSRKNMMEVAAQIMNKITRGSAICKECGEIMECMTDSESGSAIWVCSSCGYKMSVEEYEYESGKNTVPVGCAACGGPYPDCQTVCKIVDV